MKRIKLILAGLLAASLSLMPIVLSTVTTGCKTQSAQTVAYQTLYSVSKSVEAAYSGYNDLLVAGKVPMSSVSKIIPLYRDYQTTMNLAVTMARGNTNAVASADLLQKASKLTIAIANVTSNQ